MSTFWDTYGSDILSGVGAVAGGYAGAQGTV